MIHRRHVDDLPRPEAAHLIRVTRLNALRAGRGFQPFHMGDGTMYEQMIREAMAGLGRVGAHDPKVIEAWMRVEHSTLDGLSRARFNREVGIALECADNSTTERNLAVARSFGFRA